MDAPKDIALPFFAYGIFQQGELAYARLVEFVASHTHAQIRGELRIRDGLLLEGGGKINGSFLAANLIDELSVLIGPVADGRVGTPTLFDVDDGRMPARKLKLISTEKRAGGIVWRRYKVRR